jgi:endonuclease/exonuclease/phosphatase family metal-dependent hydrolase
MKHTLYSSLRTFGYRRLPIVRVKVRSYRPTAPSHVNSGSSIHCIFVLKHPNLGWDAPNWNRILTIGEFKHKRSGRNLVVMNTHLDDQGEIARRKGAEIIVDRANALLSTGRYEGVLLTGDFNSEPSEDAYGTVQHGEASPFFDISMTYDVGDMRRQGHQNTYTVTTLLSVG